MNNRSRTQLPPPFHRGLLAPSHWPTWLGLGLLWLLSFASHPLRSALARLGARLYRRFNPRRTAVVATNLRLCFPEENDATRARWLRRYTELHLLALLDLGRIRRARHGQLTAQTEIVGEDILKQLRAEPGVILTVHSVGMEWVGAVFSELVEGSSIYKTFAKNPVLDWWFAGIRSRYGNDIQPRDRGMKPHLHALRSGRSFLYIADEDLGADHGVFAPFFGVEKATLPLAGKIANMTGRPVYPVIGQLDEKSGRYRLRLFEPVELPATADRAAATAINRVIETMVRDDPAQLMWSLKYFKTSPPGEEDRYQD